MYTRVVCVSVLILVLLTGCDGSPDQVAAPRRPDGSKHAAPLVNTKLTVWGSSAPESDANWYGNWYEVDHERYPGFAIVGAKVSPDDDRVKDVERIGRDSLSECRQMYGDAFLADQLIVFDTFRSQQEDWIDGRERWVRFRPKWLIVLVYIADERVALTERYRCSYVVSASEAFDVTVPTENVVQNAFRSDVPVHADENATLPAYRVIYDAIERFRCKGG